MTKPKRPRDPNQLARLIVGIATGEVEETNPDEGKSAQAIARGKKGGKKGGRARMDALSPEQRQELAVKAAAVRWKKTAPTAKTDAAKKPSVKQ